MAPPNSSSFSVRVVLPASGWEMMAKVRLLLISSAKEPFDIDLKSSGLRKAAEYYRGPMAKPANLPAIRQPGCGRLLGFRREDPPQHRGILAAHRRLVVPPPHTHLLEAHGAIDPRGGPIVGPYFQN